MIPTWICSTAWIIAALVIRLTGDPSVERKIWMAACVINATIWSAQ